MGLCCFLLTRPVYSQKGLLCRSSHQVLTKMAARLLEVRRRLHRKKLRDSKFGNELVIYWYNIGKSMKTPTLDKEIHFPTLASQKIKIQGWNVIFVLPMLVTYVIVQHRKCRIPRLEGHMLDYQVWSSM